MNQRLKRQRLEEQKAYYASEDGEKRDGLTIMVRQLPGKAEEFDVFQHFSKAGTVSDVRLITDSKTGRCTGMGYVEMEGMQGVQAALELNGSSLRGQEIVVQFSLAQKNRLAATGATAKQLRAVTGFSAPILGQGMAGVPQPGLAQGMAGNGLLEPGAKLYVGGLDYSLTPEQLTQVFSSFGELGRVDLHKDELGNSKGFGFVQFKVPANGLAAVREMDGFQLMGRPIRVSVSSDTHKTDASTNYQLNQLLGAAHSGQILNDPAAAAAQANAAMAAKSAIDGEGLDALDDGSTAGGANVKLSAAQRAAVMAKLASSAGVELPENTRRAAQAAGHASALAGSSRCIVLKNMFDRLSDEAQAPNYFEELAEDVRGEAMKMGTVIGTMADKWSNGFVYVKMLSASEAERLHDTMNGRYFAKNKIIAAYVDEAVCDKKLREAAKKPIRSALGGFSAPPGYTGGVPPPPPPRR